MSWLENKKFQLSSKSCTSKLWLNYTQHISIVQQFIWAEQTNDWKLHVETTKHMLNLFAATGHNNYAKTCWLYPQSAISLEKDHPHIFDQFMLRNDTVRRTEKICLVFGLTFQSSKFWWNHWKDEEVRVDQSILSYVLKALKDNSMKDLFKAASQSSISIRYTYFRLNEFAWNKGLNSV